MLFPTGSLDELEVKFIKLNNNHINSHNNNISETLRIRFVLQILIFFFKYCYQVNILYPEKRMSIKWILINETY